MISTLKNRFFLSILSFYDFYQHWTLSKTDNIEHWTFSKTEYKIVYKAEGHLIRLPHTGVISVR